MISLNHLCSAKQQVEHKKFRNVEHSEHMKGKKKRFVAPESEH